MMCCFLLLLTLTSCVCEPTFVVKVTQSSYQAEENHHVTLEWTFTNTQGSTEPDIVYCRLFTDEKPLVLYHLYEGVEVSESQDKQFSGRVQCDRDVLREGRVRLHVSRLRTEDSGQYQCEVLTGYGTGSDVCHLNVSAAADQHETQRPTERPGPERPGQENRGRIGLCIGLGAVLVALTFLLVKRHCSSSQRSSDESSLHSCRNSVPQRTETEGLTFDPSPSTLSSYKQTEGSGTWSEPTEPAGPAHRRNKSTELTRC